MQENLSRSFLPPAMPFGDFIPVLFQALDREGVRFCVLRNYEGFPARNVGSDVDFLICPSHLSHAISAVRSIPGIQIVGYAERYYVAHVFVEGVSSAPGVRALGLDFIWSLNWKGLPFLPTNMILRSAIPRQSGDLNFLVPSPIHEAIISLLSSLLVGGWLKEKYFPKVRQTFAGNMAEVIAALRKEFSPKVAERLTNAIIQGERQKILARVRSLRISLILRNLLHRPFQSVLAMARYYIYEITVRCTPKTLESVCILDPAGHGNSTVVEGLVPLLQYSAKLVQRRHFGPPLNVRSELLAKCPCAGSRAESGCFPQVTMTRIAKWLLEERLSQFRKRQNLTLQIIESCCYKVFVDSGRRLDKIPGWFARLSGKLYPSPDLWILLDTDGGGLQSKDRELPSCEISWQLESYRSFVKTRAKYIILDAGRLADRVTEDAYAAIIDTLAQRTKRQLKIRFNDLHLQPVTAFDNY
jgi:hypothetical protein